MHYALVESGLLFDIIAAVDINPITNRIYSHNFPDIKLIPKCITNLTAKTLDSWNVDMMLMSPPCQPFTRVGKQRDVTDERTKSFLHILQLIPQLSKLPKYLLIENVHGFENSETHNKLIEMLEKLNFSFQEFLLTPTQFGIPNSRLRYYLIAKRPLLNFHFDTTQQVEKELPAHCHCSTTTAPPCFSVPVPAMKPLSDYLIDYSADSLSDWMVADKFFRHIWVMDLVDNSSTTCCCFTKRYGRHVDGAGSIIRTNKTHVDLNDVDSSQLNTAVASLGLRFFSPREIANILGFPSDFECPSDLSSVQCYRALGNSLNVHVVSVLLRILTAADCPDPPT